MTRKLKALGLSLIAVLAMGALSAASASAGSFHSEKAPTVIAGEQHAGEDTFTVRAGTVRCSHATYAGTQSSATSNTQTVTPTYSGCKAFSFINTTIDTNGCSYTFDATEKNVDIGCPEGKAIVVTAFNCYVSVGAQNNLSSVTYTNNGSGTTRDITVDVALTGIKYTQESKSFPGCTSGTFTDGTYSGSATVRGYNEGVQVGIWAS